MSQRPPDTPFKIWLFNAGRGCIASGTRIYDPTTGEHTAVEILAERGQPIRVLAWTEDGPVVAEATAPFVKGVAPLYRIKVFAETDQYITVTARHRFRYRIKTVRGYEYRWMTAADGDFFKAHSIDIQIATGPSCDSFSKFSLMRPVGEGVFYDLTVPGPANYLAEGVWNHNSGKTRAAAEWVRWKVETGQAKNIALISETVREVREVMISGPAGLLTIAPPWCKPVFEVTRSRLVWPNGAIAHVYSAENPEQLRGPQHSLGWVDELSKFKHRQQETWDNFEFGLRLGDNPQCLVSTTPRPTETFKSILRDRHTAMTSCSTFENETHLAASFIERMREKFEDTRLGRQELHAILDESVAGALWNSEMLDSLRVKAVPEGVQLMRIVVAVDPAAGASDPESGDEVGIVVIGKGSDRHGYVLADRTVKGTPEVWAKAAIAAYRDYDCDRLVAEVNNGGDMVEAVIRAVDPNVSYKKVFASRSKVVRAEPIAALYEKGKMHHVGAFPQMESELCNWMPGTSKSPNRLDALVWAATEVILDGGTYHPPMGGGSRPQIVVPSFRDHAAPSPRFSR
jgi:phage terminase large subunit-like protein